jgi:hypothetical protein
MLRYNFARCLSRFTYLGRRSLGVHWSTRRLKVWWKKELNLLPSISFSLFVIIKVRKPVRTVRRMLIWRNLLVCFPYHVLFCARLMAGSWIGVICQRWHLLGFQWYERGMLFGEFEMKMQQNSLRISRYCIGICLEELRNITRILRTVCVLAQMRTGDLEKRESLLLEPTCYGAEKESVIEWRVYLSM